MNFSNQFGIKGRYKIQVLEGERIVEDREWADNMVVNQGIDYLLSGSYSAVPDVFRYHAVGTGSTAAAATDVGLVTESRRTGTLVPGAGNCGTTTVTGTRTFRRTFDHAVETVAKNYAEHGLSPIASAGNNLSTRAIIAGGPVAVGIGQQLRVVYDISVTVIPAAPSALAIGGTGWPVSPATTVDGDICLSEWIALTGSLDTSGVSSGTAFLCCAGTTSVSMCSAVTLQAGVGTASTKTAITGSGITYSWNAYTPGALNRKIVPSQYASTTSFNSTNINGFAASNGAGEILAYKWDQAQTKASTHQLLYPSVTIYLARV